MSETLNQVGEVEEQTLWTGHPSQWLYVWFYLLCVLLAVGCVVLAVFSSGLALLGLPVIGIAVLVRWWVTRTTEYLLTNQRLKVWTGILTRRLDELELFRVRDQSMVQPLVMRFVGLGNLILTTADVSNPTITIQGVSDIENVRQLVRNAVQKERDRRRVRHLDMGENEW
jgi:uncharacterized membrane protein YdbT with pleckstrin-like domain